MTSLAPAAEADLDLPDLAADPLFLPTSEVTPSCLPDDLIFAIYRVEVQFRGQVLGGIPKNPKLLEHWIRTRAMGSPEAQRQLFIASLRLLGVDIPEQATEEQVTEATKLMADWTGCTFFRDERGLMLRGYNFKRCLREACAIRFSGSEKWGPTRKWPLGYFAERVSIVEDRIHLGRHAPDDVVTRFPHVMTPMGSRDAIAQFDAVNQARVTFHVKVIGDSIDPLVWQQILAIAQEIGVGACRSLEYGKFNVTAWEQVSAPRCTLPHVRSAVRARGGDASGA